MQSACRNLAILLLSAVGIAYQVALMRIFSIAQWHHFAYMIISIAMLGFGASGCALALGRRLMAGREAAWLRAAALAATASLVVCHAAAQAVPFETFQLVSQRVQLGYLLALYVILAVPFFLVATCITLAFFLAPDRVGRVYFFNMAGSGLGAAAVALLLYHVPPANLPHVLTVSAGAAFLLLCAPGWRRMAVAAVPLAVLAGALAAAGPVPVRVSEYKGLAFALQLPDAEIVARAHSPLSEVTAVASTMIRETPGQISNYPMSGLGELPAQVGLYFDAGAVSPVHRFDGRLEPFAFLDYVTGALPYRLVERPRVLVLGAGGGTDVIAALSHGAEHVTAVEADPAVLRILDAHLAEFSGRLYERPGVTPVLAEGRGYLQANDTRYDLIVLPLFGSYSAAAAGVLALNESYLYTVEAVQLYLERLNPGGVLALTCWLKTPPRDAIKLFATVTEACERAGIADPARHLAFVRSWNNATIVATRSPMTDAQIAAVRAFGAERGLDIAYCPGIRPEEVNRYTILEEPVYYQAARAVLSPERDAFYRGYLFNVRPATDDRPYFFHFLKWSSLPLLWRGMGTGWAPFVEWGYVVLIGTIVQGALVSAALILLPLIVLARGRAAPGARAWTLVYFAGLGLAYMFLEIAFIQVFMRFLAYPVYAVTVVLAGFLVFSGLGSLYADRIPLHRKSAAARRAVAGVALVGVAYMVLLPVVFRAGAGWHDAAKVLLSVSLIAPLAFAMGIPFPAGMQLIARNPNALMPWAFGINGCASVLGATLATLTAVHLGFRAVVLAAILLYAVSAAAVRRLERASGGST